MPKRCAKNDRNARKMNETRKNIWFDPAHGRSNYWARRLTAPCLTCSRLLQRAARFRNPGGALNRPWVSLLPSERVGSCTGVSGDHTHFYVRRWAGIALLQTDPEAAAKAGITNSP